MMIYKKTWFKIALLITGLGSFILGLVLFIDQAQTGWPLFQAMGEHMSRYYEQGGRGYRFYHHGMMGGMGFFGLVLVFFGFIAVGKIFHRHKHHHGAPQETILDPLVVLNEAYAKGELSREVYLERKAVLEEDR